MPLKKKAAKKTKILVIDDDRFLAQIYILTLKKVGYEVLLMENGTDGIEAAKKEKPNAIILDILMPGIDGFQVLRELKKSEKTKSIPVIMLTSLSQKEDEEMGMRGGAEAYLTKSTTLPDDVVKQLTKLLGGRSK
ncbi:MAG: response regulator [Patescibacteria group bacterium]|nr:response regulator [Patescibacteria group bacterium]